MAPVRRPIDEPMLAEEEFLRERWRIYHCEWDMEDMETINEGDFTPYVPTRDDLDAWLAHWRAIYPKKSSSQKTDRDQANPAKVKEAAAVKEEVAQALPHDRRTRQDGKTDMPGTFRMEHETHVDAMVEVDWDPHSEGLKALEEGMGERMEYGVKAHLRKLRK